VFRDGIKWSRVSQLDQSLDWGLAVQRLRQSKKDNFREQSVAQALDNEQAFRSHVCWCCCWASWNQYYSGQIASAFGRWGTEMVATKRRSRPGVDGSMEDVRFTYRANVLVYNVASQGNAMAHAERT
jgi:hypothetical protein